MAFDLYFTGISYKSEMADYIINNDGCILLSQLNERSNIYNWIEKLKSHPNSKCKLFIDSGAFSAWTKGKNIDVDEYIQFLNSYKDYFEVFASVDSIPGVPRSSTTASPSEIEQSCKATWDNFLYMRNKLIAKDKLLYTFHVGEPWHYLTQALEYRDEEGKRLQYIALGGMVGKNSDIINEFLTEACEIIAKSTNPDIKVHAFGMTRLSFLENFKLYSADSTSWLLEATYGSIRINGNSICISDRQIGNNNNLINKSRSLKEDISKIIEERGFTLSNLQESAEQRAFFNLIDFYKWAQNYKYTPISFKPISLW